MKIKNTLKIKTCFIAFCLLFSSACQDDSRELLSTCQRESSALLTEGTIQHHLINSLEKEVWFNMVSDVDSFEKLSLSAKWLGWRKSQVFVPLYTQLKLLRSPGCSEDGLFTRQNAFEIPFTHGFNILKSTVKLADQNLEKTQLEAYLEVTFQASQTLTLLQDAEGNRFFKVWQVQGKEPLMLAPEGWSLTRLRLDKAFQTRLTGVVQQWATPQGDVFLGPLPSDFQPLNYGQMS